MKNANDQLISVMDAFFKKLCKDCDPTISDRDESQPSDTGPKIGFVDRLKVFEAGTRWLLVRNRIDPGGEDDEFGRLQRSYNGRSRGRGAAKATVAANGSAAGPAARQ